MKKVIFSFMLLFGATLFIPQSSFAQVVVKSIELVKTQNIQKGYDDNLIKKDIILDLSKQTFLDLANKNTHTCLFNLDVLVKV